MNNKNFEYSNVIKEINIIFKDITKTIKDEIYDISNIKTKNYKSKFKDILLYKFLYSIPENTKAGIVSSLNFENYNNNNNKNKNNTLARGTYSYRENQIPISFYMNLYKKISNLYKKLMNIDVNKPFIMAVDGSFNNTNCKNQKDILETSLNMCYYDITNDLPIELNIEGSQNKNNELSILKKYIKKANIPKNSIIVLDRAYCSYEFIDFLIKSNYKFIIRFRNNCKNFDNIKNINDIRILKYYDIFENKIPFDKYNKYIEKVNKKEKGKYKLINKLNNKEIPLTEKHKFKSAVIKIKYEYTLLTNLTLNLYNDDKIKELYKKRWDIEVFFKLLKYNFKFDHLIEHDKNKNDEKYRKLYLVNLIVIYLSKIIEKTYYYNNAIKKDFVKKENNKLVSYVYKPNKSNIIKGVYKIIKKIIDSSLKDEDLKKICDFYVHYSFIKLGEHKERKAKTPFFKWYVKGHSNRSLQYKLIEAHLTKNDNKLNKNHKVLYALCTINIIK
jgi:hypothetical protein